MMSFNIFALKRVKINICTLFLCKNFLFYNIFELWFVKQSNNKFKAKGTQQRYEKKWKKKSYSRLILFG